MGPAASVEELVSVLAAGEGAFDSLADPEPVDVLSHGLQSAQVLAAWRPDDVELQVAGLVHDIGHVVAPGQQAAHGTIGAAFVGGLLGNRVSELVRLHVDAKRYLATVESGYADRLSEGSTASLRVQGGSLSRAEIAELEAHEHFADAVLLRRADEGAKDPDAAPDDLGRWVQVAAIVADRR